MDIFTILSLQSTNTNINIQTAQYHFFFGLFPFFFISISAAITHMDQVSNKVFTQRQ